MISQTLKAEIDRYASDLSRGRLLTKARAGRVQPSTVGRYLASVHYMLRQTPLHLRLARQLAEQRGQSELASHFERKLGEEDGHDKWAEDDMARVSEISGQGIVLRPSPAIVAMMDGVKRGLERDPHIYLAYILFAEYLTVKLGPEWVAALDGRCGVPASALTVATHHIDLDKHHVQEGCDEIDALAVDPALPGPLLEMLHESMRHFSAFCDDLYDDACDSAA